MAYRYAAKIEQKLKQKKRDFGSANQKQGKGAPKPQNQGHIQGMVTQEKFPNIQEKSNTESRRRKPKSGASSIRAPLTTQVSVELISH